MVTAASIRFGGFFSCRTLATESERPPLAGRPFHCQPTWASSDERGFLGGGQAHEPCRTRLKTMRHQTTSFPLLNDDGNVGASRPPVKPRSRRAPAAAAPSRRALPEPPICGNEPAGPMMLNLCWRAPNEFGYSRRRDRSPTRGTECWSPSSIWANIEDGRALPDGGALFCIANILYCRRRNARSLSLTVGL
jgi:hypothetical protein